MDIPAIPKLTSKRAYDPAQTWTSAEFKGVQRPESAHGFEVFLEIELPGRTGVVSDVYPVWLVAAVKEPGTDITLEPPAGQPEPNYYFTRTSSNPTPLFFDDAPPLEVVGVQSHIDGEELNTLSQATIFIRGKSSQRAFGWTALGGEGSPLLRRSCAVELEKRRTRAQQDISPSSGRGS